MDRLDYVRIAICVVYKCIEVCLNCIGQYVCCCYLNRKLKISNGDLRYLGNSVLYKLCANIRKQCLYVYEFYKLLKASPIHFIVLVLTEISGTNRFYCGFKLIQFDYYSAYDLCSRKVNEISSAEIYGDDVCLLDLCYKILTKRFCHCLKLLSVRIVLILCVKDRKKIGYAYIAVVKRYSVNSAKCLCKKLCIASFYLSKISYCQIVGFL